MGNDLNELVENVTALRFKVERLVRKIDAATMESQKALNRYPAIRAIADRCLRKAAAAQSRAEHAAGKLHTLKEQVAMLQKRREILSFARKKENAATLVGIQQDLAQVTTMISTCAPAEQEDEPRRRGHNRKGRK